MNAPLPEWFPEHPDYGRHLARQILQKAIAEARALLINLDMPHAEADIGAVLWELAVQGLPGTTGEAYMQAIKSIGAES